MSLFDPTPLFADLQLADAPRSLPEAARLVEALYLRLSAWIDARLPQTGTLLVAATFSLYARHITEALRRLAHRWPFLLRASLFIVVVGIGFGLIIGALAPLVTAGLRSTGAHYLVPATLCAFIVVGILAERSGRI